MFEVVYHLLNFSLVLKSLHFYQALSLSLITFEATLNRKFVQLTFPPLQRFFALSFFAVAGDFWFCVERYDYFLLCRCRWYLHLISAVADEFEILVFVSFLINVF